VNNATDASAPDLPLRPTVIKPTRASVLQNAASAAPATPVKMREEEVLQAALKDKLYHVGFAYKHNTLSLVGERVGEGVRVGEMMDR
jgi:hypothetical protein